MGTFSDSPIQNKTGDMIPCFEDIRQSREWKNHLQQAVRDTSTLLQLLELQEEALPYKVCDSSFPLMVPRSFVARMRKGDPFDPLLLQVLPLAEENAPSAGFHIDPLAEQSSDLPWLHKYQSRILVMPAASCAVNCRYCFRRHFPYQDHLLRADRFEELADYLSRHPDVNEVILSGGDPLLLDDQQLEKWASAISAWPQIRRWRIHTRLPVVIPERITANLQRILKENKPCTMMLHINHPRELDSFLTGKLKSLQSSGIHLFNQSVLLKGINDHADTLAELSERLFEAGVIPYYLNLLDRVQGAAHFEVPEANARELMRTLYKRLPGFLVPRLVREVPGAAHKVPIDPGFGIP
jgi:EF-P beta-lysylation protein EpmB